MHGWAQIEKWRTAAGFKGTSTEVSYDARGKIEWLIDLDPTGRIILHAGKRTFYGNCAGRLWWGSAMNWKFRSMISGPKTIRGWLLSCSLKHECRGPASLEERLDLVIQSLGRHGQQGPLRSTMTLTELKYIVAVARERHFGKAGGLFCFAAHLVGSGEKARRGARRQTVRSAMPTKSA